MLWRSQKPNKTPFLAFSLSAFAFSAPIAADTTMFGWLRATWHQRRSEFTAQRLRDGPRYQLPNTLANNWIVEQGR